MKSKIVRSLVPVAVLATGLAAIAVAQAPATQPAQNAVAPAVAISPPGGAPRSFADLTARLAPAVVNVSTTQKVEIGRMRRMPGQPARVRKASLGSFLLTVGGSRAVPGFQLRLQRFSGEQIALRLMGAQIGLALSGLAAGFVSSTATFAAMGAQAVRTPALRAGAVSAAVLSSLATVLQLVLLWPFTRLVHAFSAPVQYLFRPYVIYRKRGPHDPGNRPQVRRGWEKIGTPDRR